jgi:magnesium-transporting ATPase (P-type)
MTQTSCANDTHSFTHKLCPREVSIISAITANSCVFNMTLDNGLVHISSFIAKGRTVLNAGTAAAGFMIVAYTSFSLLVFLSPCSVAKSIPFIPGIGSVLYLLLVVPVIGVTMGFTEADEDSMTVVPVKNDKSISFARGERQRLIMFAIIKALLPAALSQLIYLIAFGSLIIEFDSILITEECGLTQFSWVNVIHCDILQSYAGPATISSGALVVAFHSLCTIVTSASFLLGTTPVHSTPTPLKKNKVWAVSTIFCFLTIVIYLSITLESGVLQALPWYFYFLSLMFPLLCLAVCEIVKKREIQHEQRAAKMRRLHFETR